MSEVDLIAKYETTLRRDATYHHLKIRRRIPIEDLRQYGVIGAIRRFRKAGDSYIASAITSAIVDGIRDELRRGRFSLYHELAHGICPWRGTTLADETHGIAALEAGIDIRKLKRLVTGDHEPRKTLRKRGIEASWYQVQGLLAA